MVETNLTQSSDVTSIKEPTPAQIAAGNVAFYLELTGVFNKGGGIYADWQSSRRRDVEVRRDDKVLAATAIEDLYHARVLQQKYNDPSGVQRFERDWGGESHVFGNLLNHLEPNIEQIKKKTTGRVLDMSPGERINIGRKAAGKLISLSPEQRSRLFEQAGYSPGEISGIVMRSGIAVPLTLGIYGCEEYLPSLLGVAEGTINPFLGSITEPVTFLSVFGSAGLYYAVTGLRIRQTEKFLRNKDKIVPSITAAGTYFLLEKLLADNPRAQRWSTVAGYLANPFELAKELWWAMLLIPDIGTSIFTAGNIAAIGIGAGLYTGLEAANAGIRSFSKIVDTDNKKQDN